MAHTINGLRADHGGPSRSAGALAAATRDQGIDVSIVAGRAGDEAVVEPGVSVFWTDRPGAVDLFRPRSSRFGRTLADVLGTASLVHDHGLWLPSNRIAASVSRGRGVPRVVSLRGMVSDWALAQGTRKKRTAWHLYQRRDLASASLLHATSEREAADARRLGTGTSIALIPNGVSVPATCTLPERPAGASVRRALFLSRIHPKKGLLDLMDAWGRSSLSNWELVIAGPDEGGHLAEVERAAAQAGILDQVRFVGPVADEDKWSLYRSADLFVLPTHSENFGIVVAEALAAGVPVITTKGAPWSELETQACGWWTEIGSEPLAAALAEAASLSTEQLRTMGERGRRLVEARYSWERAAGQMIEAYLWITGGGCRPDFVTDGHV